MPGLRVAVVSTFFPNASAPYRTLFVRHLVNAIAERASVRVIAPLAYAPPWPPRARWLALRAVPSVERQGALEVEHPRYMVIPGIGSISGRSYARAISPSLERLVRAGEVDVIHAHCAYPDAVGVSLVARRLGVPFVVTAHGSDINVYSQRATLRGQIRRALLGASAVIAVSEALRARIEVLAPEIAGRVACIPCCGVTPSMFHVADRATARATLGLDPQARVVLFVGNLVPIKGVDTLLAAWTQLLGSGRVTPADRLALIGDGPLRARFESAAAAAGMQGTVRVLGARPQAEIAVWMQAASLLSLSSQHEGMPNVVVEALASGLPVVATAVGGVPELVQEGVNGYLVPSGEVGNMADALAAGFARMWDAVQIADTAAGYNWANLAARNLDLLSRAVQTATTR